MECKNKSAILRAAWELLASYFQAAFILKAAQNFNMKIFMC